MAVIHSVDFVLRQSMAKCVCCYSFRQSLRDRLDREVLPSSLPGSACSPVRRELQDYFQAYRRRAGVVGDAFGWTIVVELVPRVVHPDERAPNPYRYG
jgi:hypothetical protein